MIDFSELMEQASEMAGLACVKAREQRSLDMRAGRKYGQAAELVEGKPRTLTLCVTNSIECLMRAQQWLEVVTTVQRWVGDRRLDKSRAYLEQCRNECKAKISEAT